METRQDILIRARPSSPMAALTIASSLLLTTLGSADVLPIRQQAWPNPAPKAVIHASVGTVPGIESAPVVPDPEIPSGRADWTLPRITVKAPYLQAPPNLFSSTLQPTPFPFAAWPWVNPRRPGVVTPGITGVPLIATILSPEPFSQTEWPNPYRPWRLAVSVTTVAKADDAVAPEPEPDPVPFAQHAWPRARAVSRTPRPEPAPVLLTTTLAPASEDRPFAQAQWLAPIPRRVVGLRFSHIGFFVFDDSAPFIQTSWPNPLQPKRSIDRLTWLGTRNLSLAEPPQPFSQTDWPTPPRLKPSPELLEFSDWRQLSIEDVVDDTPQSLADWPTPPRLPRSIELLTWAPSLLHSTLAPQATPFMPVDFPNPTARTRVADLGITVSQTPFYYVDIEPFSQAAWPIPARTAPRATESWAQTLLESPLSVGQDPFVPTDRPNPEPRRYPTQTWINNLQQTTLEPGPDPRVQSEWPLFLAKPPAIELRTWVDFRKPYYEDESPANQFTWPVPAPMRIAKGFGWVAQPQLGILGAPATADVIIRVRGDVGVIRVRPDPLVRIR